MLEIKNVNKKYKNKDVLNNINFNISKNNIVALLGLNGAGKTTLLNIIMGLLKSDSGSLNFNFDKKLIGIVFQENTFDEELSVYDNIFIRARLYKIRKDEIKKRIDEYNKLFGMNDFLYKKFKYCSGGQKRIGVIVRALIINPKLIILDEPTTALDIVTRKTVWNVLKKLNREKNLTILFTSHYIEECKIANYLVILKSGKIIYKGSYSELINKYSNKSLVVEFSNNSKKIEVSNIKEAINYLITLDVSRVNTFKLDNSNLEDIFLKLNNAYINI